jgi:hypothetical protein
LLSLLLGGRRSLILRAALRHGDLHARPALRLRPHRPTGDDDGYQREEGHSDPMQFHPADPSTALFTHRIRSFFMRRA